MARARIRLEAQKADCSISEHRVDPIERRRPVAVKVRFEGGEGVMGLLKGRLSGLAQEVEFGTIRKS